MIAYCVILVSVFVVFSFSDLYDKKMLLCFLYGSLINVIVEVHSFSHLSRAKEEAAMRVLTVLSKYRRKLLLLNLLKSLRFIKTLQQTDVRLKELLEVN